MRFTTKCPDFSFSYSFTREKLYPDIGEPSHLPRPQTPPGMRPGRRTDEGPVRGETNWNDFEASRMWLEQQYPLEPIALGSPLLRYMKACCESRDSTSVPMTQFVSMLTNNELELFLRHYPDSAGRRRYSRPDSILYPEYDEPTWAIRAPLAQSPGSARTSTPGWPRVENLPAPAANPSMFTETYPPHLRRQTPSSNPSNKRKSGDEDDASLEYPADKKPRMWPGLSGGLRPPPRPQQPGTASISTPRTIITRKWPPLVIEPNRSSTEVQKTGPAKQNSQNVDTPETDSSVQTSTVMITKTQNDQDFHLEEDSETAAPGHQPPKQYIKGLKPQNDNNSAQEPANKDSSPLPSYPQYGNQGPVEENPGAMEIDSDDIELQRGATKMLLADYSNKRGIEEVEDEQRASSPVKKRRTTAEASDDDSVISNPPLETLMADSPVKSSVGDVENPPAASRLSENSQGQSNSGDDRSPVSRVSIETPQVDPSRKRSIEDVEDVPQSTSSPKRKRTSRDFIGNGSPPSSPFDPSERSTPTPFPRLENRPIANETRAGIPGPAPSRQQSPSYEDPTTVIFEPHDREAPALHLGPQSETAGIGKNPEVANTATAHLRDHDATLNSDSETQEPDNNEPVSPEPESQGEYRVEVEEGPENTIIESDHPRDQTSPHNILSGGNRTEQRAIGVLIPPQIPQRRPGANQDSSLNSDTTNVPVIQGKRKVGRKPGTKRPRAPQSEPQRKQGKNKPLTRSRKPRQTKTKREQQAYVGRLRSGVGERKHKEPSKYFMPPYTFWSRSDSWLELVVLEFKGRNAVQVRAN